MTTQRSDPEALGEQLLAGERTALARAITLSESQLDADRDRARELLGYIWTRSGGAIRIGVTGAPGVGKSTFINAFGAHLSEQGRRVAVLAVDPSSVRGGGSVLGDKTRMPELAAYRSSFIRPSPAAGAAGGVGSRTREAIRLCEAAGFDVVIVETVGTGQAEAAVADMTDVFLLLLAPGGGDELQGVKRGVMELADFVVVNKCDGDLRDTAQHTCGEYAAALRLFRRRPSDPEGVPAALLVSAIEGQGIDEVWQRVEQLHDWRRKNGQLDEIRKRQIASWIRSEIQETIMRRSGWSQGEELPADALQAVMDGEFDPIKAAQLAVDKSTG